MTTRWMGCAGGRSLLVRMRVLAGLVLLMVTELRLSVLHSATTTTSININNRHNDETSGDGGGGSGGRLGVVRKTPPDDGEPAHNDKDVRGKDGRLQAKDGSSSSPSTALPQWINDYVSWHNQQLQQMNESNWRDFKYLVFRCLQRDGKCGGASDRLQPIPAFGLMLANQTRRILLIEWNRPCRLEEFLVPPTHGGINWTVPSYVQFNYRRDPAIFMMKQVEHAFGDETMVDVRFQASDHARSYYDEHRRDNDNNAAEPTYDAIYHNLWELFFAPSPGVAAMIQEAQWKHRLVLNQYVSAHVRAMYSKEDRGGDEGMVRNSIHCARKLRPNVPIYFASDSTVASSYAVEYGRQINATVVVARGQVSAANDSIPSEQLPPPLHLDRGQDFLARAADADSMQWNATDYYDTFVDLYLLAGGACTSYNIGTYGKWANLISSNSSCYIVHHRNKCN